MREICIFVICVCVLILPVLGALLYVDCVYPERMAKLGYVEIEGGRYVPAQASVSRQYVDANLQKIYNILKTKKDK